ncbi:hypothetical protein QVD17_37819 [Tagetes erecta]|uniref:Uncharacterized protein n=1 Tax=Tagetes erecta TaxID=13708 RepID=A0AAD8NJJ6_TARER|nr:hypothetical protein QVD17_37819 [Tagetes erecta]
MVWYAAFTKLVHGSYSKFCHVFEGNAKNVMDKPLVKFVDHYSLSTSSAHVGVDVFLCNSSELDKVILLVLLPLSKHHPNRNAA